MLTKRTRVTVHMDPEILVTYRRMASLGGVSLAKCIGDWCESTADGAKIITQQMTEIKGIAQRTLRQVAMGAGRASAGASGDGAKRAVSPRPVIRGEMKPPTRIK